MKKIILLSLFLFSFTAILFAYGYNQRTAGAKYLAELGFIQKRINDLEYNATSYITRAELTAIALKFAGEKVPEPYTCKKYFTDVTQNDWICAAVEKAADIGLISRNNKKFNPQSNITRPEAVSLILKSSGLEGKIPADISNYERTDIAFVPNGGTMEDWLKKRKTEFQKYDTQIILIDPFDWRFSTFQKALYIGIIDDTFTVPAFGGIQKNYEKYKSYYDSHQIYSFKEDSFIIRGDAFIIFGEAYKKMQLASGEVNI